MKIENLKSIILEDLQSNCVWISDFESISKDEIPEIAKKQPSDIDGIEYEYIIQSCGICGDDYSGTMFYPAGNDKYLKIEYSC